MKEAEKTKRKAMQEQGIASSVKSYGYGNKHGDSATPNETRNPVTP